MGHAKDEQKIQDALKLCVEIVAIKECPNHPGTYIDLGLSDSEGITNLILEKNPDAIKQFVDKEQLLDYIQEAMSLAAEVCYSCNK